MKAKCFRLQPFVPVITFLFSITSTAIAQDTPGSGKQSAESSNPRIKYADSVLQQADNEALKACALAKVKIRQKVIKDLEEGKATAQKAGNLDAAVEFKNRIDQLQQEMNQESAQGTDGSSTKKAIIGRWPFVNDEHELEFLPDGTLHKYFKGNLEQTGQWDMGDKWLVIVAGKWIKWGEVKDLKWSPIHAEIVTKDGGVIDFGKNKDKSAQPNQTAKPPTSGNPINPFGAVK